MWRSVGTTLSALGFMVGGWAAPYTHLHQARPDEPTGAAHDHAVLHSHLPAPQHHHETDLPGHGDQDDDDVVSIDAFVVHGTTPPLAPPPAALPDALFSDLRSTLWLTVPAYQPPAHGPPPSRLAAPRAPPLSRPAFL